MRHDCHQFVCTKHLLIVSTNCLWCSSVHFGGQLELPSRATALKRLRLSWDTIQNTILSIDLFRAFQLTSSIVFCKRKTTLYFSTTTINLQMRKQHWAPIQMKEMLFLRQDLENPDHWCTITTILRYGWHTCMELEANVIQSRKLSLCCPIVNGRCVDT